MNAIKPTLIITLLYNPKAQSETSLTNSDIYEKLIKHLARVKEEGGFALSQRAHKRYWTNLKKSISVVPFALNELKHLELEDIAIVQVGINIHDEVVTGWCEAEERLAQAMKGLPSVLKETFVGRTLVYAAIIPPDADAEALSQPLLDQLRLKDKHEYLPHKALAACPVTGGKLWLLKTGASGEANIYMALETEAKPNPFKQTILFGYKASLIYPDVIAHKAYYMARDYTIGDLDQKFHDSSEKLMTKTIKILAQQQPRASSNSVQRNNQAPSSPQQAHLLPQSALSGHVEQLNNLSEQAANLTTVTKRLHQLHSHLKLHQFDYQLAVNGEAPLGDITNYHHHQQNRILFRLNEALAQANAALDATNTALNYLRADYERQQAAETKQLTQNEEKHAAEKARVDKQTQDIIAAVGIALSVAKIFSTLPIGWQIIITLCSGVLTFLFLEWWRR